MKGDDSVFYTFNAVTNARDGFDRQERHAPAADNISSTPPIRLNPIWVVVSTPKFTLNGNSYVVNLSTTLSDGVTSRYTLVVGGKSYLFDAGNTQVTVDRTRLHLQPDAGRRLHRDLRRRSTRR